MDKYNDDEKKSYLIIKDFREMDPVRYAVSKREYINSIEEKGVDAFRNLELKAFNCFDFEMANATINSFRNEKQEMRMQFVKAFSKMWYYQTSAIDKNNIIPGLDALIMKLEELKVSIEEDNRFIFVYQIDYFIDIIRQLEQKYNQ